MWQPNFLHILQRTFYIDRSRLLYSLFYEMKDKYLYITAPSKFGKTINVDLIEKFCQLPKNEEGGLLRIKSYNDCDIYKTFEKWGKKMEFWRGKGENADRLFEQHFGKHLILRLNYLHFSKISCYKSMLFAYQSILKSIFNDNKYLLTQPDRVFPDDHHRELFQYYANCSSEMTESHIENGIPFLSQCLIRYTANKLNKNLKIFLLIDDFDAPVRGMIDLEQLDQIEMKRILDFIYKIPNQLLDDESLIDRAFFTGISSFGLNDYVKNLKVEDFSRGGTFTKYFGFERSKLESKLDELVGEGCLLLEEKSYIQNNYDGYLYSTDSNEIRSLYNNFSVLTFIYLKQESIWIDDQCSFVYNFLKISNIKRDIELLLNDNLIPIELKPTSVKDIFELNCLISQLKLGKMKIENLDHLKDLLYQYYLDCGFFTLIRESKDLFIKLATNEIKEKFSYLLSLYYHHEIVDSFAVDEIKNILIYTSGDLLKGKLPEFSKYLNYICTKSKSIAFCDTKDSFPFALRTMFLNLISEDHLEVIPDVEDLIICSDGDKFRPLDLLVVNLRTNVLYTVESRNLPIKNVRNDYKINEDVKFIDLLNKYSGIDNLSDKLQITDIVLISIDFIEETRDVDVRFVHYRADEAPKIYEISK